MKQVTTRKRKKGKWFGTSVSISRPLLKQIEDKYSSDPEWNFSKYVREMVRRDLELAEVVK